MIEQGDVMTLNNTSWFDGSGNTVEFSEILKYITSKKDTHEIHVGSDSQPYHSYVIFAITICLYLPGRGATYYVSRKKSKSKAYKNLGVRLQYESELAIYVANHIRESLALDDITIHADISPNPVNKSFKYVKSIKSFIQSMGFECIIKPDSWAAWVADKHAK